jgi:hypothetical protein
VSVDDGVDALLEVEESLARIGVVEDSRQLRTDLAELPAAALCQGRSLDPFVAGDEHLQQSPERECSDSHRNRRRLASDELVENRCFGGAGSLRAVRHQGQQRMG